MSITGYVVHIVCHSAAEENILLLLSLLFFSVK